MSGPCAARTVAGRHEHLRHARVRGAGAVSVPAGGAEAFALAAINAGAQVWPPACGGWAPLGPSPGSRRWTTYVVTPESDAPVTLSVCATNPATGACAASPSASVEASLGTFTVFVTAVGPIPGGSRIAVRLDERQWVHEDTIPVDFSPDLGTRASVSVEVRVTVP